jgi:hypothetical protein
LKFTGEINNIIIECINVMCTNHTHGIHVFVALEEEETVSDLQILEDYATIIFMVFGSKISA